MDALFKVRLTNEAVNDLKTAYAYIAEDNADAAQAFLLSAQSHMQIALTQTPRMGSPMQLDDGTEFRSLVTGSYRSLYTINDETQTVSVFRILHTARDINVVLKRPQQ